MTVTGIPDVSGLQVVVVTALAALSASLARVFLLQSNDPLALGGLFLLAVVAVFAFLVVVPLLFR